MVDLLNEIVQTMRNNKLRTALTGLSVAWGIFMLISLVSVAKGITTSFERNMMNGNNQKIAVWSGVTTKPYHGYREGRRISLKNNDIDVVYNEHKDIVNEVTSEFYSSQSRISTNKTSVNSGYTGVFPSTYKLESLKMLEGRFISQRDLDEESKVMVLSIEFAEQLFPPNGKGVVGKRVNCGGVSFLIIGVYLSDWRRTIYIPYTTARALSNDKEYLGQMTLLLNGVDNLEEANRIETGVRQTLASVHDFDPEDRSSLWIWNAISRTLTTQSAIGILNIGVWVLGLLTLLSGIIGISNIMFVSVKERTHEIGIRRAIGAKPSKILVQILMESVAITTLFGYIGIIMGTAFTELLSSTIGEAMFNDAHVDLVVAAQVTVVLIIAGALAGLFPALKALKVKPVEALRDE